MAGLTFLATSREPIGVAGELSWRLPSLSLTDEAIELFRDRARHARHEFAVTDDNVAWWPSACSWTASHWRSSWPRRGCGPCQTEIRVLCTTLPAVDRRGGRPVRHRTLRASVGWSHALLSDAERRLFRRLAVFLGGFDLDAAQAVTGGGDMPRHQVLDLLTLLVDKSLVVADETRGRARYRLLETVRQYAAEKLGESGEADDVRTRHRDHYTSMAALLDGPASSDYGQRVEQTEAEIDDVRAAFAWSRENGDAERALALASSLSPLWQPRPAEGVAWLDVVLDEANAHHLDIAPAVRARALADRVLLAANIGWYADLPGQADEALTIARQLDDPALLTRVLAARGLIGFGSAEAQEYRAEAIALARKLGDRLRLSHILSVETLVASFTGDRDRRNVPAAQEGCELAEAIGYRAGFVRCRWYLGLAQLALGDCAGAVEHFRTAGAAAEAGHYANFQKYTLAFQGSSTRVAG